MPPPLQPWFVSLAIEVARCLYYVLLYCCTAVLCSCSTLPVQWSAMKALTYLSVHGNNSGTGLGGQLPAAWLSGWVVRTYLGSLFIGPRLA